MRGSKRLITGQGFVVVGERKKEGAGEGRGGALSSPGEGQEVYNSLKAAPKGGDLRRYFSLCS